MERLRKAVIVVAVVVGAALMAGYENGPALQAGEGVDRARDEDRVFDHRVPQGLTPRSMDHARRSN